MPQELPSVCTLDCPDTCSLTVLVEEGQITGVRGSKANPLTRGVICNKVSRYIPEFVHGEGRLTHPLLRLGPKGSGEFKRITWDEALDRVYEGISQAIATHGPQSVLPLNYAGPHGMLSYASMDMRFFHKIGASLLLRPPICGGVRSEAYVSLFGPVPGIRPEQVADAQLVIVWGNNVTCSNLHLMPIINEAKAKGAKVVVIDPRRIKVAEQAHMHLPLLPGTDVVLAWAVAAELERRGGLDADFIDEHVQGAESFLERARAYPPEKAAAICGVPEEDIRTLAEWIHTRSPVAISIGNGLERNRNGGSGIRAAMALPALAGKFGQRGGGLVNGAGFSFPKTPARLTRPEFLPQGTRSLNIIDVGRHLNDPDLDPPIKALFIYNHNPVIVHPDQNTLLKGLRREDLFVVGCDVVMTDSLAYADVVLPAASQFEVHDLYPAYGQQWLQRAEPVIKPVGECLANTEIFRRLAQRFGFDDAAFSADDPTLMNDAVDGNDPRLGGMLPSRLPTDQATAMTVDGEEALLYSNVFPKTASGKIELESPYLAEKYGQDQALPGFQPGVKDLPLVLISPASDRRISSTFGGLSANADAPTLDMHPQDAQSRGLKDGSTVRVWNSLGEVHLSLRITDTVRPGVVCSLKGAWMRTSDNGQTISALTPADHADICEGACFNDALVEVEPYRHGA